MAKQFDVIVVGELNVDLILNDIESFPEMGKEKIAGRMNLTLGSSSAIFASNLSSLGAKVAFLGKIGKDSFADLVLSSLEQKRVDTSMIIQDPDLATGATIVLNYGEDRAMVTHPGAMDFLGLDDITDELLERGAHLHFSSCFLQPKIKPDLAELFARAKNRGLTTSFDAQWDPAEKWDIDLKGILANVDVFLPNEVEAKFLSGENNVDAALAKLSDMGKTVVVKRGQRGSLSRCGDETFEAEAFLNERVVDAIGAGDSFNAGFIYKFIQGKPVKECQIFGNITGAVNTTQSGGTAAFVNLQEVLRVAGERFGYRE